MRRHLFHFCQEIDSMRVLSRAAPAFLVLGAALAAGCGSSGHDDLTAEPPGNPDLAVVTVEVPGMH
jgi:hypothetical protein